MAASFCSPILASYPTPPHFYNRGNYFSPNPNQIAYTINQLFQEIAIPFNTQHIQVCQKYATFFFKEISKPEWLSCKVGLGQDDIFGCKSKSSSSKKHRNPPLFYPIRDLLVSPASSLSPARVIIFLSHAQDPVIGKGGYKKIRYGIDAFCGNRVAVATINKKPPSIQLEVDVIEDGNETSLNISLTPKTSIDREISIMYQTRHIPQMVHLDFHVESSKKVCLVMELMPLGDLKIWLKSNSIKEKEINNIAKDCLVGLSKLHQLNYVHNDIKPANIFLSSNEFGDIVGAKIGDLGLSTRISSYGKYCGTIRFLSPEKAQAFLLKNNQETRWVAKMNWLSFSQQSDVWAMGLCLYFLMTQGDYFIASKTEDEALNRISRLNQEYVDKLLSASKLAFPIIALLKKMLQVDPLNRCTAEEALSTYLEILQKQG